MRVFRELVIRGPLDAIDSFFASIDTRLEGGWSRNAAAEAFGARLSVESRAYEIANSESLAPATLFFVLDRSASAARVSNVVPVATSKLSTDQYNAIVVDFARRYVARYLISPCDYELTSDEKSGEAFLTGPVNASLRKFSAAANKSTGSGHPLDRKRWLDFLLAAHAAKIDIDAATLHRILTDENSWSEEIAWDLVRQYESGIELLQYADSRRAH